MRDSKREGSLIVREKQGHPGADKEPGSVVHARRTTTGSKLLWSRLAEEPGSSGSRPGCYRGREGVLGIAMGTPCLPGYV